MSDCTKRNTRLLKYGALGTVVAALFCFTPVLVVLVAAVGLSAITGYLDYVLYPALGFFVLLTLYALWRRRRLLPAEPAPGGE